MLYIALSGLLPLRRVVPLMSCSKASDCPCSVFRYRLLSQILGPRSNSGSGISIAWHAGAVCSRPERAAGNTPSEEPSRFAFRRGLADDANAVHALLRFSFYFPFLSGQLATRSTGADGAFVAFTSHFPGAAQLGQEPGSNR